jgi:hypothetical protein
MRPVPATVQGERARWLLAGDVWRLNLLRLIKANPASYRASVRPPRASAPFIAARTLDAEGPAGYYGIHVHHRTFQYLLGSAQAGSMASTSGDGRLRLFQRGRQRMGVALPCLPS